MEGRFRIPGTIILGRVRILALAPMAGVIPAADDYLGIYRWGQLGIPASFYGSRSVSAARITDPGSPVENWHPRTAARAFKETPRPGSIEWVQCLGRNLRRRGDRRRDDGPARPPRRDPLPQERLPPAQGQGPRRPAAARHRLNCRPVTRDASTHSRSIGSKGPRCQPPNPLTSPTSAPNPPHDRSDYYRRRPDRPTTPRSPTRSASPYGLSSARGSSATRGSVSTGEKGQLSIGLDAFYGSSSVLCFVRFGDVAGRLVGPRSYSHRWSEGSESPAASHCP
jgi:hypothetical protein